MSTPEPDGWHITYRNGITSACAGPSKPTNLLPGAVVEPMVKLNRVQMFDAVMHTRIRDTAREVMATTLMHMDGEILPPTHNPL